MFKFPTGVSITDYVDDRFCSIAPKVNVRGRLKIRNLF